jgi:hypothetical protein
LLNDRAIVGYGFDLSVSQANNTDADRVRTELSEANLDGLISDSYVCGLRRDFAADQQRSGPGGDNVSEHFSA